MKARAIKTLFLITFLVIIVIIIRKIIFNNTYKIEYKEYVTKSASSYGVEEALIYSIIKNESGFNEKASLELALAAYNAGSGNVDKWITQGIINDDASNIENIPYKETNLYVRKVIRDYKIYEKILK